MAATSFIMFRGREQNPSVCLPVPSSEPEYESDFEKEKANEVF